MEIYFQLQFNWGRHTSITITSICITRYGTLQTYEFAANYILNMWFDLEGTVWLLSCPLSSLLVGPPKYSTHAKPSSKPITPISAIISVKYHHLPHTYRQHNIRESSIIIISGQGCFKCNIWHLSKVDRASEMKLRSMAPHSSFYLTFCCPHPFLT